MKREANPRRLAGKRREQGYAIVLVLLMATLMLIATMAVAPNILNQGRREREKEMIWRGKQYVRGIKMYYRKTGKFPTSLEDLTKPKIGNIRFMRRAYKDPMNAKDGEWRLIYVGSAGQLIGSLKPKRALQLTGLGGFQNMAAPNLGGQPSLGRPLGHSSNQIMGNSPGIALGGMPQSADTTEPGTTDADSADSAENEALLASEPATIMGGNIIGVGSKINQRSLLVYDKAKNYRQFEFIWDPSKDVMTVGSQPPAGSTPLGQPPPQQIPFGPQTTSPANPSPMPPETTPDEPQQEPQ